MYSFNEESCAFGVRVSFFSSFLLAWCRFVCQLVAFHHECSMAGLEQAPKIHIHCVQFYCVFWLVSLKKSCTFDAEFFLRFFRKRQQRCRASPSSSFILFVACISTICVHQHLPRLHALCFGFIARFSAVDADSNFTRSALQHNAFYGL